jgi:hypothetical protein
VIFNEGSLPFALLANGGSSLSFMPKELKRCYGQKDLRFLPFCRYHGHRHLQTVRARNLSVKVLGEAFHYGMGVVVPAVTLTGL